MKNLPPFPDRERIVLVTGSSRGLGREVAIQFARLGDTVIINCDIDEKGAVETQRRIEADGGRAVPILADVSCADQVDTLFDRIAAEVGSIDILVNNVGYPVTKLVQQSTPDEWDDVLRVNLKSTFLCSRRALPVMRRGKRGRIVNVGSAAGVLGGIGQTMYSSAKAGLLGLTRSVAREAVPFGITVNVVAPGFMRFEMGKPTRLPQRAQRRLIPMGRFAEHDEIAALIVFLASSKGGYITGQQILIDGGLGMC